MIETSFMYIINTKTLNLVMTQGNTITDSKVGTKFFSIFEK